jgi:hypothetical protein
MSSTDPEVSRPWLVDASRDPEPDLLLSEEEIRPRSIPGKVLEVNLTVAGGACCAMEPVGMLLGGHETQDATLLPAPAAGASMPCMLDNCLWASSAPAGPVHICCDSVSDHVRASVSVLEEGGPPVGVLFEVFGSPPLASPLPITSGSLYRA